MTDLRRGLRAVTFDRVSARAALGLCAALLAGPASGQPVFGSLAGIVVDETDAVVPGVEIRLVSLERGTEDRMATNDSGRFVKERLMPGLYEVRATRQGFESASVSPVRVGIDAQTQVKLRLLLGPLNVDLVVAVTPGQLLKTDRSDVVTLFDRREVSTLPLVDRNPMRLALLTPGAQQLQWQHAASENPQASIQMQINGQPFGMTGYELDGTENRDPVLGVIVINPTLESIAELKVTTQNLDAEFGQANAGLVSVRTRSGGNFAHGSAFEQFQSDRFQARNPFTQPPGEPLPDTERHQFGGSLGGPLRRDRVFGFVDYQGVRGRVGGSRLLTVPTARARVGDLSEYATPIFDPTTGPPDGRLAFAGAVIPAERLAPQALALLRGVPLPNRPGIRDNYLVSGSEAFDSDAFNVRLDAQAGSGRHGFLRFSFADFDRDGAGAFGSSGGREIVSLGGASRVRNLSLAAGFDREIDARSVLDARFGFFQYKVDVRALDYGTTPAAEAGIPGLNVDPLSSGMPAIYVQGQYGFNMGYGLDVNRCNCPLIQDEKALQLAVNLTRVVGNHTLKAGLDVRRAYNLRLPSDAHRSGEISFSPDRTRGPEGGGLGLATFLLGDATYFRRFVSGSSDARERQWRHAYYVQDTFRAGRRLTISGGLRLEVIQPQTVNAPGNGGWLDLGTGEILVGGVGGTGLDGDVENSLNWAPRVGVTYQIDEETVLRAGYARSYDIGVFGTTFGGTVTQTLPVLAVQELNPAANHDAVFNLAQGPPPARLPAVPASGRFPLPDGVATVAHRRKMRLPAADAWNLALQRQLTDTTSLELAYVANRGTHSYNADNVTVDANQPTLVGFAEGVPRDLRRPYFAGPVGGFGAAYGWTQRIDYYCNCGESRYDSLQARLVRRVSRGLQYQAAYTLQRAVQDGDQQFLFDPELDRGRPEWDRTHNFALAALVELPFGKGRRFLSGASGLLDALVGGWQLNTSVLVQSGARFSVTYADAGADRDVGPNRPDQIGDPRPGSGDGIRQPWFNATPIGAAGAAFARPAVGTFGDMPRNALTGPGYWRVDASLSKRFALGSRAALDLLVEAVNLFNHVNLGLPDAEVGTLESPRPNAGYVTSTAFYGADPQRNLQFGVRVAF
jgi:hypothetical protein